MDDHAADAALATVGPGLLSGRSTTTRPDRALTYLRSTSISADPGHVIDFCRRASGFTAIMPEPLTVLDGPDTEFVLGGRYAFRWWLRGIVPVRWVAHIDHVDDGREFSDLQLRGVFRYFHHTHTAEPDAAGTRYTDRIVFATALGAVLDRIVVRRELDRVFRRRHQRMRRLLEVP